MPSMLDALNAAAAPPATVHRKDYRPPDWLVPDISLDFELGAGRTRVRSVLTVERNGAHDNALQLNGEGLTLIELKVDGQAHDHAYEHDLLTVPLAGQRATIETLVEIEPRANTQLMGLYESGGILCTQCEAEGFRRITFFPDRPDVLSRYRVRMSADKAAYPVLLSNGNQVGGADLDEGQRWA